ncbi:tripartite tricarboxylate transporter TctB family protein [Halomonas sp. GFAJ-1]|uniref:tripartite tricarboxylate transporter TctB family protein n=1 Tax=Halomonas sp. GFAJ-1 TaxID=1118153 RepID=UPI00023A471A|nr:tripartite tricarboxylate transporter TctB family protein [Halomonas sp. GFAJ-1]AVI62247.1 hypothetical protein BB497_05760 [Halomonas sp. GFAJ-1]EHK59760.1 hypothetical protein MOY_14762 [Halomonas sp. GFAJ-1]
MNHTLIKELLAAAVVLSLGIAGLIHIQLGAWRPAPLVPSYIMPQTAYYFLIASGVWILGGIGLFAVRKRLANLAPPNAEQHDLVAVGVSVFVMIIGAVFYFLAVLNIGLVVSTVVFNAILVAVLAPNASLKTVLIVPLLVGLVVWLLFMKLIGMTLPTPLLF